MNWKQHLDAIQREFLERPGYRELRDALLAKGGKTVILRNEPDLDQLNAEGAFMSGKKAVLKRMGRNCHTNAGQLWVQSKGRIQIVTGWALTTDDGVWRQHSWGWDTEAGKIIETTVLRDMYFGIALEGRAARAFAEGN